MLGGHDVASHSVLAVGHRVRTQGRAAVCRGRGELRRGLRSVYDLSAHIVKFGLPLGEIGGCFQEFCGG